MMTISHSIVPARNFSFPASDGRVQSLDAEGLISCCHRLIKDSARAAGNATPEPDKYLGIAWQAADLIASLSKKEFPLDKLPLLVTHEMWHPLSLAAVAARFIDSGSVDFPPKQAEAFLDLGKIAQAHRTDVAGLCELGAVALIGIERSWKSRTDARDQWSELLRETVRQIGYSLQDSAIEGYENAAIHSLIRCVVAVRDGSPPPHADDRRLGIREQGEDLKVAFGYVSQRMQDEYGAMLSDMKEKHAAPERIAAVTDEFMGIRGTHIEADNNIATAHASVLDLLTQSEKALIAAVESAVVAIPRNVLG